MFSRIVEIRCKEGKNQEAMRLINEKVVPLLRKQQGFRDEIVLHSSEDPNRLVGLSFWDNKEDAERYQRDVYSQVTDILRPACEGEPRISSFNVSTSTAHKITQEKAA